MTTEIETPSEIVTVQSPERFQNFTRESLVAYAYEAGIISKKELRDLVMKPESAKHERVSTASEGSYSRSESPRPKPDSSFTRSDAPYSKPEGSYPRSEGFRSKPSGSYSRSDAPRSKPSGSYSRSDAPRAKSAGFRTSKPSFSKSPTRK